MPKPVLAIRRPQARVEWHAWLPLLAGILLSLATLAAGIYFLWMHATLGSERVLAPAGCVLAGSALLQLWLLHKGYENGRVFSSAAPGRRLSFWKGLVDGALIAFVAVLLVGPREHTVVAWLAGWSLWYAALLLPLAATPVIAETWRRWTHGRVVRRIGWVVPTLILSLAVSEAALQIRRIAVERQSPSAASVGELAMLAEADATLPDDVDLSFSGMNSGRFRLAIVGHQPAQAVAESSGYLARLQHMVPGLEVIPIEIPRPWSSSSIDDVARRLNEIRPDLALTMVPACDNLAPEPAARSWFDWRQFELSRLFGVTSAAEASLPEPPAVSDEFESHLGALAHELAACRTPMDSAMRTRWQRTFAALDKVSAECHARRIPVALVLLPSQFQLSRVLRETLVRRTGCASEQVDLDLPQRQLASFAENRQLPVIDLLPHLSLERESLYLPGASSWNERGNAAAAAAIGGWLESRYGGQLALAAGLSGTP